MGCWATTGLLTPRPREIAPSPSLRTDVRLMTSQGSAIVCFEPAVRTGNPNLVIAAAHELPRPVLLRDALRVPLVLVAADRDRFLPAAARFAARLVNERRLSVAEAQLVFAALQTLASSEPLAGGEALCVLLEHHGERDAAGYVHRASHSSRPLTVTAGSRSSFSAAPSAVSSRRATWSIVPANSLTTSSAPSSPQPAMYGIVSPPRSSPTLDPTTKLTVLCRRWSVSHCVRAQVLRLGRGQLCGRVTDVTGCSWGCRRGAGSEGPEGRAGGSSAGAPPATPSLVRGGPYGGGVSGFRPSVAVAPSSSARFSALRVVLPGGLAYWTVVDDKYELAWAADAFLRDLRFGADRTESTTRLYASELALFLDWATASGRDLERAGRELSRFVLVLRTTPVTRRGRGYGQLRSPGRINHVLSVVREFYKHTVAHGRVSASVIAALYEVGDDRFLPVELRAEDGA